MGRTGKMFAMEHFGVNPDMMAVAKGIASGLPRGALVARSTIMDWEAGSHASTFGGNPVSCQAAMVTIELLEQQLITNAATQGEYLMAGLHELQKKHESMGDVRGKGLMIGVELVKDRQSKEPARVWRTQIIKAAFKRGLLLLGCGENSIRFSPSLTVTSAEIDECLTLFDEAINEVASGQAPQ
jgi:4-aminobutyrate aminotransferase